MSLGLVIGQKAKEWTLNLSFSLIWGTPIHYRNAGFRRFIFICRAGHQTQGHKHATQVGLDYIPTQGFTLGVYVLIVCVYMYSVYLCTCTCILRPEANRYLPLPFCSLSYGCRASHRTQSSPIDEASWLWSSGDH